MNKKYLIFFTAFLAVVIALVVWIILIPPRGCNQEIARQKAEKWILENSPTYKFDGYDLAFSEAKELDCQDCYEFVFWFNSKHAGYGKRSDRVLAQVITPHTVILKTENCNIIVSAVTDGKYDEIAGDFLPNIPNISVARPLEGDMAKSPLYIRGEARNVFEGTVNLRLKEKGGDILVDNYMMIEGTDLGKFGPFQKYLIFPKPKTKEGILEVFYISPEDGFETDKVSINLKFNLEEQGLEVQIQREGSGQGAKIGDKLKVDYIGLLKSATKFDSSYDRGEPFEFTLGRGQVIAGWDLGVLGMKVGERRKLIVPPELAYGETGVPNSLIGPNAVLIFEIELLEIVQ